MGLNSKDKRDIYYKMSKLNGYRARSIYKLMQIDEHFNIFENIKNVVDLCGAPGSWSQYAREKLKDNGKIVIIDLQEIYPIEGVIALKEDITTKECISKVLEIFSSARVDLIMCDGAPDITGIHDLDEYFQSQLVCAALKFSLSIGKLGCNLIVKMFRGKYCKYVVCHFKKFYREVHVVKPKASRASSIECFLFCKNLYNLEYEDLYINEKENIEDFEVIGIGTGPDPDLTINESSETVLKHKYPPINPPYKEVINFRK